MTFFFALAVLLNFFLFPNLSADEMFDDNGLFSGRISRYNGEAGLVRVKVDFNNFKYLNKKDKVEFWDEKSPANRCKGYIVGKSNEYFLMKVPNILLCQKDTYISNGVYLIFYSQDLVNNLKMGKSLVGILLKKRVAILGMKKKKKKELEVHMEKINSVNLRFDVLRKKLENEWREEISALEEDRLMTMEKYKKLEIEAASIDAKIERYKISSENLEMDRWALDPRLYYKK